MFLRQSRTRHGFVGLPAVPARAKLYWRLAFGGGLSLAARAFKKHKLTGIKKSGKIIKIGALCTPIF